jgi:hypothetical protein
MCTGPAADAVVAVTLARPNIRSPNERLLSMVWIRLIGAIRQRIENQPDLVYRAWSVTSQRCTRYRQRGMIRACAVPASTVSATAVHQAAARPATTVTAISAATIASPLTAARAVQYLMARRLTRWAGSRRPGSRPAAVPSLVMPASVPRHHRTADGVLPGAGTSAGRHLADGAAVGAGDQRRVLGQRASAVVRRRPRPQCPPPCQLGVIHEQL